MKTPLADALLRYASSDPVRLHMPGHKGRLGLLDSRLDVTELPQTGNLFEEDGIFAASEREAAKVYEVGGAAYSAGGSTLCIQAMISRFCCGKKRIVLQRSCHKSAAAVSAMLGLTPIWLTSEQPEALFAELEQKIAGADAVLLTTPDYFGRCLPLEAAARLCSERQIPLLIDAAHGAHYPAAGLPNPIAQGADAACVSLHKTLPALTGAAAVLTRTAEDAAAVKHEMTRFGSSSPSFLIAKSCEDAVAGLESARPDWEMLRLRCEALRRHHPCLRRNDDFSKLWISPDGLPHESVSALLERYALSPELFDDTQLLLMLSPCNTDEELARTDAFLRALERLPRSKTREVAPLTLPLPEQATAPYTAFCAAKERVSVTAAEGRICAEVANVCPPCACLLCYGERIDAATVKFLQRYGISAVDVVK